MKIVTPDAAGIAMAVASLRAGCVVAYPTETVYGLAVDPFNEDAIRRLFRVKGRPETNPVLLVIADPAQLAPLIGDLPPNARDYMDRFWPGPLSLVLPRRPGVSGLLTAGTDQVCVRQTASPVASALCTAFGGAITSTSANRSGEPPALALADLHLDDIDLALDGGVLPPSPPSTILDPATNTILREGAIPSSALRPPSIGH